jgi:O-antigen biosynthesis protein
MSLFANFADIRDLGAPVVGLFRTALGRDPVLAEFVRYVPLVRRRVPLQALAAELVEGDEFRRRYRGVAPTALAATLCRNAFGAVADQDGAARLAIGIAGSHAELVAVVASTALAQGRVPLLPGLAIGAPPDDRTAYRLWVAEYDQPDPEVLAGLPVLEGPLVTLATAAGDTEVEAVQRSFASLRAQSYRNWELCLAARTFSAWPREAIARLSEEDARVRLVAGHDLHAALAAATGSLVCLLAAGDRLAPAALHAVVAAFAAQSETKLVFTDEDVEDESGRHSPRFKPAFSPDAALGGDAIGQLAAYRAETIAALGGLPEGPDAVRALARRAASALAPAEIRHVPGVLCHRGRPPADIDLAAARRAGRHPVPSPAPRVTVVVPTKDRADLLRACAEGVLDRTDYPATEMLVVDNGSTEPAALALIAALEERPNVRVMRRSGPFNFAALNNAAADAAGDGLLLLLNNDTEVTHPDWLGEMVAQASRPGVGVVGARLLYPDRTVQHAGILLGPDGAATHVGRHAGADDPGYLAQLACVRDLSAVTAACLMVSTGTWRRVGGMDERLAVTWNDVDFCLRVRKAGLRVVWTPHATLLHHESITRGLESADPAALARFEAERAIAVAEWGEAIEHDPFLNPNLVALEAGPLALARPRAAVPAGQFASSRQSWHQVIDASK